VRLKLAKPNYRFGKLKILFHFSNKHDFRELQFSPDKLVDFTPKILTMTLTQMEVLKSWNPQLEEESFFKLWYVLNIFFTICKFNALF